METNGTADDIKWDAVSSKPVDILLAISVLNKKPMQAYPFPDKVSSISCIPRRGEKHGIAQHHNFAGCPSKLFNTSNNVLAVLHPHSSGI